MQFLRSLYSTNRYPSLVERERARAIYGITSLLLLSLVFLGFTLVEEGTGENLWQMAATNSAVSIPLTVFLILTATCYSLTRLGYLSLASISVVLAWGLSFGFGLAALGFQFVSVGIVLAATIVLGGLLLGRNGLLLGSALTVITLIFGLSRRSQMTAETLTSQTLGAELLLGLVTILFLGGLVYLFVRLSQLGQEEHTRQFIDEQRRLTRTISKISEQIAHERNLDETRNELLAHIVDDYALIYHAQIFQVDEQSEKVTLIASTGEIGQSLLAQRLSFRVDRSSAVGRAISDGKMVLERHVALEALQQRSYLPDTRTQVALPLLVGSKVIGVLDLHSEALNAFSSTELTNFQTIANYAAIVIHNADLVDGTQQQLEANRILVEQSQTALQQVEELNSRLTGQAWSVFLEASPSYRGVDLDLDADISRVNEAWTPHLQAAARENSLLEAGKEDAYVVAVPVRVRGQVIGAMEFELDADKSLTASDRELINEVSERFGLAAENARLYEESRRIAQREALINEAGARLQASSDVEKTLIEAARSVQEILKVNRVAIQLGEPPVAQSNGNGKDSA